MRTQILLLGFILSLLPLRLRAQGTIAYLWTWNGDSGLFQGSFETPADYLNGDIEIGNGLYNLSFTSPDRTWTSNANISGDHTSFIHYSSGSYGIDVYDPSGEVLVADATSMAAELGNTTLFGELGSWTITQIPEPSVAALLTCGAAAWLVKRKRISRAGAAPLT